VTVFIPAADMGGAPHSGKIFGFFDPANPGVGTTQPFNSGFVDWLGFVRKGPEVERFNLYRNVIEPEGTFMNQMVEGLLGCDSCSNGTTGPQCGAGSTIVSAKHAKIVCPVGFIRGGPSS